MEHTGGKCNDPFIEKNGTEDAYVVEVPRQKPRIVDDNDIAGTIGLPGKEVDDLLHAQGHGTGLTRCAEGSLYQFLSPAVGEHAGIVVGIPQQAGKGGTGHGGIRFIDDGNQPPPEDLQCDGIEV